MIVISQILKDIGSSPHDIGVFGQEKRDKIIYRHDTLPLAILQISVEKGNKKGGGT